MGHIGVLGVGDGNQPRQTSQDIMFAFVLMSGDAELNINAAINRLQLISTHRQGHKVDGYQLMLARKKP